MTGNNEQNIAGLLLAAGGSTRLGRPKQLVEIEGKTLVRRAAETLFASGCSPVIVVLGAETDRSTSEMGGLEVEIVVNEDWANGMGTSIAKGVTSLRELEAEAVLVLLCDQPFVSASDLKRLRQAFVEAGSDIAAASYEGTAGVPAVFSSRFFPDLIALTGDRGARDIIRSSSQLTTVEMNNAVFDIDEPADLFRTG